MADRGLSVITARAADYRDAAAGSCAEPAINPAPTPNDQTGFDRLSQAAGNNAPPGGSDGLDAVTEPLVLLEPGTVAHSRRSILSAVVRRSGAHVVEASVVPAVLFYGCLVGVGLHAAYLGVLAWSYGAFGIRVARGRPVPPLLVLTMIGISVRTAVAIVSGSTFVYFIQPVLSTLAMSLVFLGSVMMGRPLIASLAHEFWPLTDEDVDRPAVTRLFRNLTVLWAGINLATAVTTMILLAALPLAAFVAVKQVAGLGITAVGVYITVSSSLRMARRENLASLYARPVQRVAEPRLQDAVVLEIR